MNRIEGKYHPYIKTKEGSKALYSAIFLPYQQTQMKIEAFIHLVEFAMKAEIYIYK
jgi:hypothetical protein